MLEANDLQRKYDDMLKHDVEHEQLAIGCMVTSEFGLSQCCKLLKTEDFAVKHSRIFINENPSTTLVKTIIIKKTISNI